jgi:cell division transport system ATP-binding protein
VNELDLADRGADGHPIIALDDVDKRYPDGTAALRGISLSIETGSLCFITGPSGAGKSTLLRLIYAAEQATAGTVRVAGHDLARLKPRSVPFLRRNIGVVFQDFKLLPSRTAEANVAIGLEVLGLPRRHIMARTRQVLAQVGLTGREHLRPDALSGGEQQRVAVARAIINEPAIVLADEPTGNLDADKGFEIMSLLERVQRKGATLLVATHDMELVRRFPEARRIHLVAGRVTDDTFTRVSDEVS